MSTTRVIETTTTVERRVTTGDAAVHHAPTSTTRRRVRITSEVFSNSALTVSALLDFATALRAGSFKSSTKIVMRLVDGMLYALEAEEDDLGSNSKGGDQSAPSFDFTRC